MIDGSQIELVILNLAINARDAMPGGGRLTITTSNAGRNEPNRPPELIADDYVVVSVCDTGLGMTEEVQKKAFEPFFTTKAVGSGTGLGLSQVYGIAKQTGGAVRIEFEPWQGHDCCRLFATRTQPSDTPQSRRGGGHGCTDRARNNPRRR